MAKECEVMSKTYHEIRVLPAALKSSGQMEAHGTFSETLGFYITDSLRTAAGVHIPNQEATSIIQAEIVTVTKKSGEVWAAGDAIFWLSATNEFTNVNDGSGKLVGKAKKAAASGDATGDIVFRDYYPVQRGYLLGTVSVPYKIAASDPLIQLLTSTAAVTGTIRCANIDLSILADMEGSGIAEALRVNITTAKQTGAWINAIVGRIDFGSSGDARLGMAAAICAEMNVPGKVTPGGALYALDAEINVPTNAELSDGHIVAFIKMGVWGGAKTELDDHGFVFHIDGVANTSDGLFDSSTITLDSGTNIVFDATLKINVNGTAYYIPMATDRAFVA
ncbi:MAG: DUF2190 family protein [Candidatus Heimdallarchaeaceae archaeon]